MTEVERRLERTDKRGTFEGTQRGLSIISFSFL